MKIDAGNKIIYKIIEALSDAKHCVKQKKNPNGRRALNKKKAKKNSP